MARICQTDAILLVVRLQIASLVFLGEELLDHVQAAGATLVAHSLLTP